MSNRRGSTIAQTAAASSAPAEEKAPLALIAIRASTKEQELTIDAQIEEMGRLAEKLGARLRPAGKSYFIDRGESARKLAFSERPRSGHLHRTAKLLAERGEPVVILFTKMTRAFRNMEDGLATIREWESLGIAWECPQIGHFGAGAAAKFARGMVIAAFTAAAEMEVEQMLENQAAALKVARKKGRALGSIARFGWDRANPGDPKDTQLTPNWKEQGYLIEMKRLFEARFAHTGDITDPKRRARAAASHVAKHFNRNGIPTKRGGEMIRYRGKEMTAAGRWSATSILSALDHAEIADPAEWAEDAAAQPSKN